MFGGPCPCLTSKKPKKEFVKDHLARELATLLALLGTQLKSQSTWFKTKMLTSTDIFTSLHSLTGLNEFKYKFQNHSPPPQEMLVFIFFENENMKYQPPLQSGNLYATIALQAHQITTRGEVGVIMNFLLERVWVIVSFVLRCLV